MFFPALSTTSPSTRFRSPSSFLPQLGSPCFSPWQWCRGIVLVAQVGNGEHLIHRKYIRKYGALGKNSSQTDLITCHSSRSKNSVLWLVISSPGSCFSDSSDSHPNNSLGFSGCISFCSGGCNMAVFLLHMLRRPGRIMESWT